MRSVLGGFEDSTDWKKSKDKMTTENQIAIAEACKRKFKFWKQPFDFNSLDSMQAAILAQDKEFQVEFDRQLALKCREKTWNPPLKYFHQLAVADWQEAFVETLKQLGRFPLPQSASERKTVG